MDQIDKLKNIGKTVEVELIRIRDSINAPLGNFAFTPKEIDLLGKRLEALAVANPGEPIIIGGRFWFAYIKDHNYHGYQYQHDNEVNNAPNHCFESGNKVHFYYCPTLVSMTETGRRGRYRATQNKTNRRLIDLRNAQDVETRLPWCKHCIVILCNKGRMNGRRLKPSFKSKVAAYGDARELMDCVTAHHRDGDNQRTIEMVQGVFNRIQKIA